MQKENILAIGLLILFASWNHLNSNEHIEEENSLKKIETDIQIDGDLSDWDTNYFVKGLTNPWNNNTKDETQFDFKIMDEQFYFYFRTMDISPYFIPFETEMSVAGGDRVELFFSSDKEAQSYYCAEINPRGKVLDYKATFYRKFERDWNFKTLKLAAKIKLGMYIVEGQISLREFKELGFGTEIYMGIFRADYYGKDKVNWYTKTIPDSDEPDFHIPSAFEKISLK